MRTTTSVLVAVIAATVAMAVPQVTIPPAGLYCCPPIGPNGLTLNRQQVGPFAIFCYYDEGTTEACFYNPGSGAGGGPAEGCPVQADSNPHPPTCPI